MGGTVLFNDEPLRSVSGSFTISLISGERNKLLQLRRISQSQQPKRTDKLGHLHIHTRQCPMLDQPCFLTA